ncbi:MAG: glycosyltransferase [Desulfovibrio sp.]|nr:glycosyltransferase [Desulfovibrio sp.]
MKVAHLCMIDRNGAGTAALRVHKALLASGMDSTMFVLNTASRSPDVRLFDNAPSNVRVIPQRNCEIRESLSWPSIAQQWNRVRSQYTRADPALELFTTADSFVAPDNFEALAEADIIMLHWVAGVVNFPDLPQVLRNKPVVWRFSDFSPFTGGCHYSRGCHAFHDKCGLCPQLGSTREQDASRLGWLMKRNAYSQMSITCVAPSKWIQEHAGQSSLLGATDIQHIPNCVPLDIYVPGDAAALKKRLGITPDHKVLLFGAASLKNPRKGFAYILEALEQLHALGEHRFALVSFGATPPDIVEATPYPWRALPHLSSDAAVAEAFSIADGFLLTPEEENFPSVALESLAVGTPVVGFATGGIPEIVQDGISGFLGPTRDVPVLTANIRRLLRLDAGQLAAMRKNCRERAEHYSERLCAHQYAQLFEKTLKKSPARQSASPQGISILSYENIGSWILGKFARLLREHLTGLGLPAEITSDSWRRSLVTHHIPYLGWENADNSLVRTIMITHVDTPEKISMLMRQLAIADMGICMSRDTVNKLIRAGLPAEKLCFVHPAQDGLIRRRKMRLGITSRLYSDARKRESMLVEALSLFDPDIFAVKIMGGGWEDQVRVLRERGVEVEYIPDFDKAAYLGFFENMDYYLYLGMDEGSMGFLDALHAGVKTIVTAQGYHLEARNAPTHGFVSLKELTDILGTIASESNARRGNIDCWTWDRYAKQHVVIWKFILERQNMRLQFNLEKAMRDSSLPFRRAREHYMSGNRNQEVLSACIAALKDSHPEAANHVLRNYLILYPDDIVQYQYYESLDEHCYNFLIQ